MDELDSQYGSLRSIRGERKGRSASRNKKPMNRRSLLHSFERPTRNIEAFVSQALGLKGNSQNSDGDRSDSGLEFDYNSLPRRVKDIQIESDFDQEPDEFVLQSSSASSMTDKGALDKKTRKKTKKARFKADFAGLKPEPTVTSASTGRLRSTSLDRSR